MSDDPAGGPGHLGLFAPEELPPAPAGLTLRLAEEVAARRRDEETPTPSGLKR